MFKIWKKVVENRINIADFYYLIDSEFTEHVVISTLERRMLIIQRINYRIQKKEFNENIIYYMYNLFVCVNIDFS